MRGYNFNRIYDLILDRFNPYKVIFQNTVYLSLIEVIRLMMPFIALPYIYYTIGTANYGIIVFAQTIISYFSIFINWGLDISVVRDVAINRDNRKQINMIFCTVTGIKIVLFLVSFVVLLLCVNFITFFSEYKAIYLFSFLTCLSEVMTPIWYFQGVEKMKYLTIIRAVSIFIYTGLIFLFITKKNDFIYLPLIQSIANVIAGICSLVFLFHITNMRIVIPNWKVMRKMFFSSAPFFTSRISFVASTTIAKTLSGLFLSMHTVAGFDLAQKIISFVSIPIQMINQAIYPHVSRTANKVFTRKMMCVTISISLILSILLFLFSPHVIAYFSIDLLSETVCFVRILCFYIFCFGINTYLGTPVLVAYGFYKPFNRSVIYSTFFMVCLYTIFYLIGFFSGIAFAFIMFFTELFVLVYRFFYCMKYKLI